ncbi:ATPase, putative [Plasmodium chabaudi chabaudi]|uniref:ATPase, putative n=1 Tax=Plasmodium chabaudi chabaudi TaxID=31271 RepID=A0A1D3S3B0_PLACU|nr:ATPase, putative [Plasmodium chabaudi chabaudi]
MLHEKLKAYISNIITDNQMIEKHHDEKTNLQNVLNNMYLIENALKKTNNKLFRRISQTQLKKIILCILKNDDQDGASYTPIDKSKKKLQNKSKHVYTSDSSQTSNEENDKEKKILKNEKKKKKKKKKIYQEINMGIDIGTNIEHEGNSDKIEKHGYDQINDENVENKIKTNLIKIKGEENSLANSSLGNVKICLDNNTTNLNTYKGINNIKKDIYYSIVYPYKYRNDNFNTIININGINGSGKTSLAYAIAGECDSHFFYIKLPEYVRYLSNDNKNNKLRILFEQIKKEYNKCILCIDDMDILFNSKDDTIDIYIFTYLLNLFDNTNVVIILLSINKPYDTILYSKIQKFISMPIPTYEDRIEILQNLSQNLEINFDVLYTASITYGFNRAQIYDILNESRNLFIYNHVLHDKTTPYVVNNKKDPLSINMFENEDDNYDQPLKMELGDTTHYEGEERDPTFVEDTSSNCVNNEIENDGNTNSMTDLKNGEETEKVTNLTKRKERNDSDYVDIYIKEKKQKKIIPININNDIIYESIKNIKKKITTQNICEVPNINLDNIGSLKNIKKILETKFILPVKYSNIYKHLGINKSMGILLYGPPGCGKTMLAKAISNEMKANFIAIKGPEILNKYVGESEKKVREIFSYASTYKPCLIFFDEIDSICINRDNNKTAAASDRVVNQLLTEMDGLSQREGIYIIATTNRPDIIDKALLRTGRFDQLIYVSLPKYQGRIDILKKLSKNMPLDKDIDFKQISMLTKGYSGADLHGVLRESAFIALQECRDKIDRFNYKSNGPTPLIPPNNEHTQEEQQNCFTTTSENTLNPVLNKTYYDTYILNENYGQPNDNKLDDANPKSLEHYSSESGQAMNNEMNNPCITDQSIYDVVENKIMTMEEENKKLGERQKEDENNKDNFLYKIDDLKNENLQEKDKNNLIYEFIQKNKNILAIKQKHILLAINIVPRSVTKKQMKYYKEISKKFK